MENLTLLCFIAVAAIIAVAVWWACREHARMDDEAVETFTSPMDGQRGAAQPQGRGGPGPVIRSILQRFFGR